jgi:putative endonuclease
VDGTLYTGYARDPAKRAAAHNAGKGARYTAGRRPVSLVYWEAFASIGDALRRERELKKLRREAKEVLLRRSPHRSCSRFQDGHSVSLPADRGKSG